MATPAAPPSIAEVTASTSSPGVTTSPPATTIGTWHHAAIDCISSASHGFAILTRSQPNSCAIRAARAGRSPVTSPRPSTPIANASQRKTMPWRSHSSAMRPTSRIISCSRALPSLSVAQTASAPIAAAPSTEFVICSKLESGPSSPAPERRTISPTSGGSSAPSRRASP